MSQGKCDRCGSVRIDYETIMDDGKYKDSIYYTAVCEKCGYEFEEVYTMHFVENIKI